MAKKKTTKKKTAKKRISLNKNQKRMIWKRYYGDRISDVKCLECPRGAENWINYDNCEFDHIKPLSRGGGNHASNFKPICGECNRKKGSKTHKQFKDGQVEGYHYDEDEDDEDDDW